jgi:hypothetical protein
VPTDRVALCALQVTSDADEHVQTFYNDGVAALQAPSGPDLHLAENYLAMAHCIDNGRTNAAVEPLEVVREALRLRQDMHK